MGKSTFFRGSGLFLLDFEAFCTRRRRMTNQKQAAFLKSNDPKDNPALERPDMLNRSG